MRTESSLCFRQNKRLFLFLSIFSTEKRGYTTDMKVFLGFFWLCALFALCFLSVHTVLYFFHRTKKYQKPPTPPPAPPVPEPVYYIVEKRSRKKNVYSTPKKIKFE